MGHQVQKYCPTIQAKYKPLPASIEILFEKDVAKLVSNKLPGEILFVKDVAKLVSNKLPG